MDVHHRVIANECISMLGVMVSLMFVVGVMDVIKTVEVALIKEMNVEGTIFARKNRLKWVFLMSVHF